MSARFALAYEYPSIAPRTDNPFLTPTGAARPGSLARYPGVNYLGGAHGARKTQGGLEQSAPWVGDCYFRGRGLCCGWSLGRF